MTRNPPLKVIGSDPDLTAPEVDEASDVEGLRLIKAFWGIHDAELRKSIVELVERVSARFRA